MSLNSKFIFLQLLRLEVQISLKTPAEEFVPCLSLSFRYCCQALYTYHFSLCLCYDMLFSLSSLSISSPHKDISHIKLGWAQVNLFFSPQIQFVTIESLNFKQILGLKAHIHQFIQLSPCLILSSFLKLLSPLLISRSFPNSNLDFFST